MKTNSVSRRKAKTHRIYVRTGAFSLPGGLFFPPPPPPPQKKKKERKIMQIKFDHSSRLGNEFFLNLISPITFIILGEYCEIQKGIPNEYIAM